jgi:uncharacterized repeat protein (TIGR01451 family)
MRSPGVTLFAIMLPLTFASALTSAQADGDIVVQSIAETEVEVINRAGRKEKKREPVALAIPGSKVIYTTRFTNKGNKPAGNVVINNPIPENTVFVGGSAFGTNTAITYSVNGGKNYDVPNKLKINAPGGAERQAEPRDYTHIRWRYVGELPPGKRGEVGFRVVIK